MSERPDIGPGEGWPTEGKLIAAFVAAVLVAAIWWIVLGELAASAPAVGWGLVAAATLTGFVVRRRYRGGADWRLRALPWAIWVIAFLGVGALMTAVPLENL